VGDLYQGQIAYGEELRKVYNDSAFILDIRQPQARTGLTQRIFDASACARPVLVEYSPELELFFEPEDELFYFMNPEQALDLKSRYFHNCRGGNIKAEKARRNILSRHTYRHRAAQVLKALRQY
jgi:spore maturation protein CgeB